MIPGPSALIIGLDFIFAGWSNDVMFVEDAWLLHAKRPLERAAQVSNELNFSSRKPVLERQSPGCISSTETPAPEHRWTFEENTVTYRGLMGRG